MLRPDVVAGRFALCDPLARGASGTVWRAWDLRLGRYCAAKVMRQRDASDPLRFAREQGLRLTHPHLLTPYSWAAEDEHVVVASRLVAGGSAHTLLGDYGALSGALVADLLDQLLAGLEHAHGAGVVHRDVTLANLLLDATDTGRPHLWLADFGLAVRTGEPRLTQLGTVIGTPGYLPPEVLAGARPAPGADLFAAGQVAAALLRGAEPDGAGDRPELPGAGSPLREVVAALTEPDPADRPASAAEARRALSPVSPASRPLTATGEPVAILVQLPDLPAGWTAAGPGELPAGAGAEVAAGPPTGPVRVVRGTRHDLTPLAGAHSAPPAEAPTAPPVPDPSPGTGRRPGRLRHRGVLTAAVVAVLAAATAAGAALLGDRGDQGGGPGGPSGTPTTSGAPAVPAAAGDPCGWQQEGDVATAMDGRTVTCVRVGDGYRWQAR